jgi:hypothetical protein
MLSVPWTIILINFGLQSSSKGKESDGAEILKSKI